MLFFIFWPLPEKLFDCPKKNYFARLWGAAVPPQPLSSYAYELVDCIYGGRPRRDRMHKVYYTLVTVTLQRRHFDLLWICCRPTTFCYG